MEGSSLEFKEKKYYEGDFFVSKAKRDILLILPFIQ